MAPTVFSKMIAFISFNVLNILNSWKNLTKYICAVIIIIHMLHLTYYGGKKSELGIASVYSGYKIGEKAWTISCLAWVSNNSLFY